MYKNNKLVNKFEGIKQKINKWPIEPRILLVNNDILTTLFLLHKENKTINILLVVSASNEKLCNGKFPQDMSKEEEKKRQHCFKFYDKKMWSDEEELVRRTDILLSCKEDNISDNYKEIYPIDKSSKDSNFLLMENIKVLKDRDLEPIKPFFIDVMLIVPNKNPKWKNVPDKRYEKYDYADKTVKSNTKEKITKIIKMGTHYNCTIVGGWGCDNFRNPYYGNINMWNNLSKKYSIPCIVFSINNVKGFRRFKKHLKYV